MTWRFFQCLQQRIECVFRQHVHFVDDVNLVARGHRRIAHRLDNFTHIIDAGMARRIHFDNVDMPPLGNCNAGLAYSARVDRRAAFFIGTDAIERFGDQPRSRGFSHTAHPGHQECMRQPVALDRVAQCLHHGILANESGKSLRPIFARQYAVSGTTGFDWFNLHRHIQSKPQRVVGHVGVALGKIWISGIRHCDHVRTLIDNCRRLLT